MYSLQQTINRSTKTIRFNPFLLLSVIISLVLGFEKSDRIHRIRERRAERTLEGSDLIFIRSGGYTRGESIHVAE